MKWGIEDVIAAAALVLAATFGWLLVRKIVDNRRMRAVLAVGIALVVLSIWAHLAVGIL